MWGISVCYKWKIYYPNNHWDCFDFHHSFCHPVTHTFSSVFHQFLFLCLFDRIISKSNTKCVSVWKRGIRVRGLRSQSFFTFGWMHFNENYDITFIPFKCDAHTDTHVLPMCAVCVCGNILPRGTPYVSAVINCFCFFSFSFSFFRSSLCFFSFFRYLLRRCLVFSGSFSTSSSSSTSNIIIHYRRRLRRRHRLGSMDAFVLRPYNHSGIW